MTNIVKRSLRCLVLIALFLGLVPVAMMAAEGDIVVNEEQLSGVEVDYENNIITVSGTATMTGPGNGDAVTINADTNLVFEEGATLTLSGYTSANMNITAQSQMDVFRLRNNGQLSLTGSNTIIGSGKEGVTNRAIVLEGNNAQNQAITLGANTTLAAHNFYRGLETGGAKNYTISGAGMDSSTFNFSNNNCGMALSYFDQNATFEDCTLEVSNCDASGIFMRQDNAALDGLYIDNVNINCVNDIDLDQSDIAIRFHSNKFRITNSNINIVNAWNTGLWIYDGWNANEQNEITGTTITVNHVENNDDLVSSLFGSINRRKAITFVPYRDWLISDCEINIDGQSATSINNNTMEGGINIGSDITLNRKDSLSPSAWEATPGMHGGKVIFEDTTITTSGVLGADVGAQVGQWIEIGKNVVSENGENDSHYTVICDDVNNGYPVKYLFGVQYVKYITTGMSEENQDPDRLIVTGGSYRSTRSDSIKHNGVPIPYACSVPVNEAGEDLTMFEVPSDAFDTYASDNIITLVDCNGISYPYEAASAPDSGIRYIWAPAVTVTFEGSASYLVPRGTAWGLTHETIPDGSWMYNDSAFTADTVVMGDMTVTAQ